MAIFIWMFIGTLIDMTWWYVYKIYRLTSQFFIIYVGLHNKYS